MKHFYLNGSALFQDNVAPIHWPKGLTEWSNEAENDVNHILRPSQSQDCKSETLEQRALRQHNQNTNWGDFFFWKNGVPVESMLNHIKALVACGGPTAFFFFPLICLLSVNEIFGHRVLHTRILQTVSSLMLVYQKLSVCANKNNPKRWWSMLTKSSTEAGTGDCFLASD